MSCPVFPKPVKKKMGLWLSLIKRRSSWLDGLYQNSYWMRMGQFDAPKQTLFMPNHPDFVKQMLFDDVEHFPKHELLAEQLRPLLGDSIFTTNGMVWRRQRDMLDVAFGARQIDRVFPQMQQAVGKLLERIAVKAKNGTFDIDQEMTLVTADIIFRTIMSTELDDEKAKVVLESFERFQRKTPRFLLLRLFGMPLKSVTRWFDRSRIRDAKVVREAIEAAITPRYQAFKQTGRDEHDDILAQVLNAKDEQGQHFSLQETVDQVAMLFLAGHETSASGLTWSLYLLALYPEWQQKIRGEMMELGAPELWTPRQLKECQSLKYLFMEALRLYPPVGFFMRENRRPQEMNGKPLKQGDLMVLSPWLLHRHTELWDEPHSFCPARFDSQSSDFKVPKNGYLPFGAGPRVCIGAAFAMQEAYLILASILRTYNVYLKDGFEPKPVGRLTIRSENGLQVSLEKVAE